MKYTLSQHADSRPGLFYYSIPELSLVSSVVLPDKKNELQAVVDCLNKNMGKKKKGVA